MAGFLSISQCYQACNAEYSINDPNRLFCKKACDSDGDFTECKNEYCTSLCIKEEIGDEDQKHGSWSKMFARAPGTHTTETCLAACFLGCKNKSDED